jgi:hypothetical protein
MWRQVSMGNVDRAQALFRSVAVDPAASRDALLSALSDDDQLLRMTAAVQLAHRRLAPLADGVIREMVQMLLGERRRLEEEPPIYQEYSEATATAEDVHDLGQDLALALAELPAGSADFAIRPLVDLWQQDVQFYEAILAAIALAFAPIEIARPAQQLTEDQRYLVRALANDQAVWTCCGDTAPRLAERGLPASRATMHSYLATGTP